MYHHRTELEGILCGPHPKLKLSIQLPPATKHGTWIRQKLTCIEMLFKNPNKSIEIKSVPGSTLHRTVYRYGPRVSPYVQCDAAMVFAERDLPFDCSSSCSLLFYYFCMSILFVTVTVLYFINF